MDKAALQARFSQNLLFLEKTDPKLADQLHQQKDICGGQVQFESGRGPDPHVTFGLKGGSFKPLHSFRDPVKEADRFIQNAGIDPLQNLVILGLGLGYHLFALLEQDSRPASILVLEGDIRAVFAFCHIHDIQLLYQTQGLTFKALITEEELFYLMQPESFNVLANGIKIIRHRASQEACPDYYRGLEKKVEDFFHWANANISTQIRVSGIFSNNIFRNLPRMMEAVPCQAFRGCLKGMPAIIVAAGPSLAKNGYLLQKAKGKAAIFAVDTTLRVLSHYGVQPEFVVSTDFTRNTTDYFTDLEEDADPGILLVDPEVCPDIVETFPGPISFCDIEGKSINVWLSRVLGDYGTLPKGLSVSHTAFTAAVFMGASPIIFVGQDLAFTEGRTHVRGASHGVDMVAGEHTQTVPGLFGPVQTSKNMKVFLDHYEELIARTGWDVIDATEGGARIRNAQVATLRETIMNFAPETTCAKDRCTKILRKHKPLSKKDVMRQALYRGTQDLKQLLELCQQLATKVLSLQHLLQMDQIDISLLKKETADYQKVLVQLKGLENTIDFLRDNMVEAYVIRAKRFPKSWRDLDILAERKEAMSILGNNLAYYKALEKAALVIKTQVADCLEELSLEADSRVPKGGER